MLPYHLSQQHPDPRTWHILFTAVRGNQSTPAPASRDYLEKRKLNMRPYLLGSIALLWVAWAVPALAVDEAPFGWLGGIEQIGLVVRGYDQGPIRTAVALELRRVGIRVIDAPDVTVPYLDVFMDAFCNEVSCAVMVNATFWQAARLSRDLLRESPLITWSAARAGLAGPLAYPRLAREMAVDMVQGFANAYLAANPDQARMPGRQKASPQTAPVSRR
jgi:hypothetical protein